MSSDNRAGQTPTPSSSQGTQRSTSLSRSSAIAFGGLHLASACVDASTWMMINSHDKRTSPNNSHGGQSSPSSLSVERIRESLRKELEKRLSVKKQSIGTLSAQQAAICLEKLLFKQYSGDLTEYANLSTLRDRLDPILQRLIKRKDHPTETLDPEESRKRLLRSKLGKQRYWKALLLSKEIHRLRLQHASLGCAQCNSDGVWIATTARAHAILPSSAFEFFESASEDEIASSKLDTWDTLIQECEDALHRYKQWRFLLSAPA